LVDGEAAIGKTTPWLAGLQRARARCRNPALSTPKS